MKKLAWVLLLSTIIGGLSGCGNTSELTSKIEQLENENEELKAANIKLQGELDVYKEQEAIALEDEKKIQEEKNKYKQITLGETVVVDNYGEFTIEACDLTQKVMPPNPESFYTYYEVKDPNEIYLDVAMKFKNTSTISLDADEITSVKVYYDEGYEYSTFSTIEESGGSDFTYTNITRIEPLKASRLHYLATLPIEVKDSNKALKMQFEVYGSKYELQIR